MPRLPFSLRVAFLTALVAAVASRTSPRSDAREHRHPAARAATASRIDPAALRQLVDSVMRVGMADEHIPGAAVLVLSHGRVVLDRGYGFADAAARRPVDPHATLWPFASITKVVTATALMRLVERGRVDLDADVNRYLKVARVPDCPYGAITARHLLTHTDGLDELPGRRAAPGQALQPLGAFLSTRLVRTAAPGRVTRYGSYGIALAGAVVEDVSGQTYAEYVRREIFTPLGMRRSSIGIPAGPGAATAYEWDGGSLRAVPFERYHTPPTSSLVSTVDDMARFAAMHLGGDPPAGAPRVLARTTIREMAAQQASVHPDVPGWGYGWQMDRTNGQRVVEHGGDIGGFASLVTLLPDSAFGLIVVHHLEGSSLRFRLKRAILDRFFPDRRRPPAFDSVRRDLGGFAGTWLANNWCRSCADGAALAQRFEITDNGDGSLMLWDTRWRPVAPLLFADESGRRTIGFMRDAAGSVVAVSGGAWRVLERAPRGDGVGAGCPARPQ